jgi:hypothetical protein
VHKQGSHLDKQAMADLEAFQEHADLDDLRHTIRDRIMQLVQARPGSCFGPTFRPPAAALAACLSTLLCRLPEPADR